MSYIKLKSGATAILTATLLLNAGLTDAATPGDSQTTPIYQHRKAYGPAYRYAQPDPSPAQYSHLPQPSHRYDSYPPAAYSYSPPNSPPSADTTAADLLIARPGGLAATVLGAVVLVVGLPFTLINGSTGQAAQKLVVEPAEYTFTRPLGEDL